MRRTQRLFKVTHYFRDQFGDEYKLLNIVTDLPDTIKAVVLSDGKKQEYTFLEKHDSDDIVLKEVVDAA